jgi:hypothetical protein
VVVEADRHPVRGFTADSGFSNFDELILPQGRKCERDGFAWKRKTEGEMGKGGEEEIDGEEMEISRKRIVPKEDA